MLPTDLEPTLRRACRAALESGRVIVERGLGTALPRDAAMDAGCGVVLDVTHLPLRRSAVELGASLGLGVIVEDTTERQGTRFRMS